MKLSFSQVLSPVAFVLLVLPLHAQWQRQYPLEKLENILDIDVHDDGYGFAVGANDLLLRLDESTQTWKLLDGYGQGWRFEAVDYLSGSGGQVAVAAGDGLILTINQGEQWDEIAGAPAGINTIKLFSPTHLIAIADAGAYEWENETWTDLEINAPVSLKGGFIYDYDHIWAFTFATNPAIYYTTNGGDSWNTNLDIADTDVVSFFDAVNGVATDGRKVYTTVNGGVKWDLISTNAIHNTSNDIAFGSSVNVLMAATLNADPAHSINGGLSWTQLSTDQISDRSYSIASLSDSEFWLGNDLTSILHTADAGQIWEERSGPERNIINDVFYPTRAIGFGLGNKGMLVRTENGGASWDEISFGSRNHFAMHGTSPDNLWMGASQRILHSTNQGDSWTESLALAGGNVNDIYAVSDQRIIAAVTSGIVLITNNGGINWDTAYNAGALLRSIAKIDDQRYMITGFNGTIIRSEDQGQTWVPIATPDATLQYEQAYFLGGTGWLVTSSFKNQMWSTHDNGDTWIPINLPIDRFWDGVYFMSQDTGIIVGRSSTEGRAYITFTGGTTWTAAYITSFPFYGVTGFNHPNGTACIYGVGSNIEELLYCTSFPGITDLTGDAFPCEQDTVPFFVSGSNIEFYHWSLPPGWTILGNEDSNHIQVVAGTTSGFISVVGSNECGETGALSVSAAPDLLPDIFELQGDAQPCAGELTTYTAIELNVDNFSWTYPSGWTIIGDKDEGFLSIIAGDAPGVISVIGTNQCGSTQEFVFNVNPFIIPEVATELVGSMLTLSEDAFQYFWFVDGVEIPGATSATFVPIVNGTYSCMVTFGAGCSTMSTPLFVMLTAIDQPAIENIRLYPVPADHSVTVTGMSSVFDYRIADLTGKIILSGTSIDNKVNVRDLLTGMYLLAVEVEGKTVYLKFVRK
ncbi:MAG: YCF48-related protein [Bacteroidota bacterium]|nr:YCF48-related protein [Bacteroidota bacterium]